MEAVIFIGIQATGKSTYYKDHFFKTHVRINMDMLKTRHREDILLDACIKGKQSFVVDNTNPTLQDRKKYINKAKASDFTVVGYYFQSNIEEAIARNNCRTGKGNIPLAGIRSTHAKLELPIVEEGFDKLYYVRIDEDGKFIVEEWKDEI